MSQNDPLGSFGREARAGESGMSSHRAGEAPTWNEERIEQLKVLWEQGLSASSIGRVLGVTKNAVVGKAHRLKLSSRPSPIRKSSKPPVRRATALARPTLPNAPMVALRPEPAPASCEAKAPHQEGGAPVNGAPVNEAPVNGAPVSEAPVIGAQGIAAQAAGAGGIGPQRTAKALAKPSAVARQPLASGESFAQSGSGQRRTAKAVGRTSTCLWPIGDPGDRDFHFCEADTLPGKPYCAEHCSRAYVTKSRADSEAA